MSAPSTSIASWLLGSGSLPRFQFQSLCAPTKSLSSTRLRSCAGAKPHLLAPISASALPQRVTAAPSPVVEAEDDAGRAAARNVADQILRDLQNNPDMWLQVVHILQNSQNLNTKFFALQVLYKLIPANDVLIVDDGSTDHTSKVAFEFVKMHKIDNVRVLLLGRNHGKGEAVRKGMLHSRGELLLMLDADGATKVTNLEKLEAKVHDLAKKVESSPAASANSGSSQKLSDVEIAVFGSCAHLEKQALATRKWYRNVLMKGFHLVVLLTAGPGIRDTQCGFKMFTRAAARKLFTKIRLKRWCFDVELVYHLKIEPRISRSWTSLPGTCCLRGCLVALSHPRLAGRKPKTCLGSIWLAPWEAAWSRLGHQAQAIEKSRWLLGERASSSLRCLLPPHIRFFLQAAGVHPESPRPSPPCQNLRPELLSKSHMPPAPISPPSRHNTATSHRCRDLFSVTFHRRPSSSACSVFTVGMRVRVLRRAPVIFVRASPSRRRYRPPQSRSPPPPLIMSLVSSFTFPSASSSSSQAPLQKPHAVDPGFASISPQSADSPPLPRAPSPLHSAIVNRPLTMLSLPLESCVCVLRRAPIIFVRASPSNR
uniref:dolichyl-phosphate beta-glucosyltransferase n=1 Tax=Phyllostachys edulis TaxID=38705 RepID=L0P291_PHYED|nr:PH01B001E05.11 [Phyllostachys edulis]